MLDQVGETPPGSYGSTVWFCQWMFFNMMAAFVANILAASLDSPSQIDLKPNHTIDKTPIVRNQKGVCGLIRCGVTAFLMFIKLLVDILVRLSQIDLKPHTIGSPAPKAYR